MRDSLKEQHINYSIEEGERRKREWDIEERRRDQEKKNMYRSELRHQIEERKKMNEHNREVEEQRKQEYRKYGKSPQELTQYDRQRHL